MVKLNLESADGEAIHAYCAKNRFRICDELIHPPLTLSPPPLTLSPPPLTLFLFQPGAMAPALKAISTSGPNAEQLKSALQLEVDENTPTRYSRLVCSRGDEVGIAAGFPVRVSTYLQYTTLPHNWTN